MNVQDELSANILGIAIEHARIDKGLTREDLAERIRKSERYILSYPIRKTTKNWILPAMILRPCVQLTTGEYNLRLQTDPAKLYN